MPYLQVGGMIAIHRIGAKMLLVERTP